MIAGRFLERGADVVICARNAPEEPVSAAGRTATFVAADVRDPDQVAAVVDTAVGTTGRIDVLVNNAGGAPPADTATVSPRFNEKIVGLNLLAPLLFAQAVHDPMSSQDDGGVIINIASVSGTRANPQGAAYGAAKAGLINLSETLAHEWGPNIRVLCPVVGMIVTEEAHLFYGDEEGIAAVGRTLPLERMGTPDEVADVVLFCASPLSAVDDGGRDPGARRRRAARLPRRLHRRSGGRVRRWVVRRVVAVLLVAVAVSVVAAPAGAQESDDEPPSEDRSIPDDAFTIVGSPDPGPEPEHPGDRGGWAQFLTLGLIVAGVGGGGLADHPRHAQRHDRSRPWLSRPGRLDHASSQAPGSSPISASASRTATRRRRAISGRRWVTRPAPGAAHLLDGEHHAGLGVVVVVGDGDAPRHGGQIVLESGRGRRRGWRDDRRSSGAHHDRSPDVRTNT